MAKQTITHTLCDFDNTEGAETVRFGLDGRDYEIDLSAKRQKQLRDVLGPFLDRATPVQGLRRVAVRSARTSRNAAAAQRSNADVRAWALEHGYEVSARGRIKAEVVEAYDAAH